MARGLVYRNNNTFPLTAAEIDDNFEYLATISNAIDPYAYGAVGNGSTICTAAFQAAINAVAVAGGGTVRFGLGTFLIDDTLIIPSNVTLEGTHPLLSVLIVDAAMSTSLPAIRNENNSTDGSLTNTGIVFRNFTLRNERPDVAWLSKADGTPVADPETDYLPGGCLAPTVQPEINLTLTDGVITGAAVDVAGSGVDYPVAIWVTGDGKLADLRGVISAGALSSVTITNGGEGFTTATAVVAGGGADPVTALYAADRRNPGYKDGGGIGIQLTTCDQPLIEHVIFEGFGGNAIVDRGCDALLVQHCRFEDGGQSDFVGSCLWSQSFGTPPGGASFRYSTRTAFRYNHVVNHSRSVVSFGGKNPCFEGNVIEGWGESCVFTNEYVENYTVRGNVASGGRITDIVCQFVEGVNDGLITGNTVYDCDGEFASVGGSSKTAIVNNTFTPIADADRDGTLPFGPFSERVAFGAGGSPVAGTQRGQTEYAAISIVEQASGDTNRPKRCLVSGNRIGANASGAYKWMVTFSQGAANAIEGVSIVHNDLSDAPTTELFNVEQAEDCLNRNKPFIVRDNVGAPETHMLSNIADHNVTDNVGAQDLFDDPAAVNLWGLSRYKVAGDLIIVTGSNAHDVGIGFTASEALASISCTFLSYDAALNTIVTTQNTIDVDTAAITDVITGSTATRHVIKVAGIIETDAATTITPQFALSAITGVTVRVKAPSTLRFIYDGPAGRESVGNVT